ARHRLGDVLPRGHADGRHARRPAAPQARRRGSYPHRPRGRVQASGSMSLLHSLRARLFAAIGLIVALSVAVTLVLGLVLTRRAVEDATLKGLGHQAALIVGEERNALSPLTHLPQLRPYLARQHERYLLDTGVLPAVAQRQLAAGRPRPGPRTPHGAAFNYAA